MKQFMNLSNFWLLNVRIERKEVRKMRRQETMQEKILIVDDESMILNMLKLHFTSKGFLVYTAADVKEALQKLEIQPDLILLDINMPGMNGLDFCQMIRSEVSCPILFVTARVEEQDIINGLMVGGDDYITKPFHMEELMARVQAHLRRENRAMQKPEAKFAQELVINYSNRSVTIKGVNLKFSNKEFEVIRFLSMNPNQVFDRETIYEKIWGFDGAGDSIVVKEHIRKIRNLLAKYTDRIYIETVWGVGYRWKS